MLTVLSLALMTKSGKGASWSLMHWMCSEQLRPNSSENHASYNCVVISAAWTKLPPVPSSGHALVTPPSVEEVRMLILFGFRWDSLFAMLSWVMIATTPVVLPVLPNRNPPKCQSWAGFWLTSSGVIIPGVMSAACWREESNAKGACPRGAGYSCGSGTGQLVLPRNRVHVGIFDFVRSHVRERRSKSDMMMFSLFLLCLLLLLLRCFCCFLVAIWSDLSYPVTTFVECQGRDVNPQKLPGWLATLLTLRVYLVYTGTLCCSGERNSRES